MLTPTITQARLEKLRGILHRSGYHAAALVPGPYIYYLSGVPFAIASRPLVLFVPVEGDPVLVIPSLESVRIRGNTALPLNIIEYTDADGFEGAFGKACQLLNLAGKRIAIEGLKMRALEAQTIQRLAPGSVVEHAEDTLMWLRIHKDDAEIAAMRRAIAISEAGLDVATKAIRPGMTERDALRILVNSLADAGGTEHAFDLIVLSGPNCALPHGYSSERTIQPGDFVLFDYGVKIDGYASDITRVFAVGNVSDEMKRIYETVLAANLAGIKTAGPGVPAQKVDQATRKVIEDAGYGQYFIHRTGHGLGLDIHEAPYIRSGNEMLLEPGMTFTIEPGIYIPGVGGVRIEDDVLITRDGAEVLTSFPKTLKSVG